MSAAAAERGATGTPVDRLRALIVADPALRDELARCTDPDRFTALALERAAANGIALGAVAVDTAIRQPLPGLDYPSPFVHAMTELPPAGWLPVRALPSGGDLVLHWAHFGERPLGEPFFEGDVRIALSRPFNRLFRFVTPVGRLAKRAEAEPGLAPSGFVFHMSRCGSTLVARMLSALDATVSISEASPIDAVVQARRWLPGLTEETQALWLRWIVGALTVPRAGERRAFVKLDSWHTLALPLLRKAFPDVPWVFLYRDPVEVLVSQHEMPGTQMIPGALGPDLGGDGEMLRPEARHARILTRVCAPVLQHAADQGLLVNYRQLPDAVWTTILPHFGIAAEAHERGAMADLARFDAKMPQMGFSNDSASKQAAASPAIRAAADGLRDVYAALEQARERAAPASAGTRATAPVT